MATASELAAEILTKREKWLADRCKVYPQDHPRASGIGECDREMFNQITNWQMRPAPEPWLQARFDQGNAEEEKAKRELSALGYEVMGSQLPLEIKDRDGTLLCRGHIDGRIGWNGRHVVFDAKSMNPNIWATVNSVDDFERYPHMRRYIRQLLLYMYAYDEPDGLFLCTDCLGHWKIIPLSLADNLAECETVLQRLRKVVDAVAAKSPESLDYCGNPGVCRKCWCFGACCNPPMDFSGDGVNVCHETEIIEALDRITEIQDAGREYNHLDDQIKGFFKGFGQSVHLAGDHKVAVLVSETTAYDVPQAVKEQYKVKKPRVQVKWGAM